MEALAVTENAAVAPRVENDRQRAIPLRGVIVAGALTPNEAPLANLEEQGAEQMGTA